MGETRATIRARVQRLVGTAINATINDAIAKAHKRLQRKHNYSQMETTSTITVSEGDTTFFLPNDFKAILNPEMSDSDGIGYQRMKGVIKAGIESRDTSDEGRPLIYRIWGSATPEGGAVKRRIGHLYSKSDAEYIFNIEYYRWLPEPPDDDEEYDSDDLAQDFLDEVYEYLELKAIAAGFRKLKKYKDAREYNQLAYEKRIELEQDDTDNALSGIDLKMELPG